MFLPNFIFELILTSYQNHTVTQSNFLDPCHPLAAGGFFSGFQPTTKTDGATTFTIDVKDTKAIWFYCSQTTGKHCQSGMVGSINAPATGNTLERFIALAANASTSSFPSGGPAGGVLVQGESNGTTTSATTLSSYTTTASYSTYTSGGATVTVTLGSPTTTAAATNTSSATSTSTSAVVTGAAAGLSANVFGAVAFLAGAVALV